MSDLTMTHGLLRPISEDAPSGPNLEYGPAFQALQLAAQYSEEHQVGDSVIEAEPPDFALLSDAALTVLRNSHDLRAAVYLTEAGLAQEGLPRFAEALAFIAGCLQQHWTSCHPQPDEDDGDVTMRVNAVAGLADRTRIIPLLRRTPLARSRAFGRVSLRDAEIADGRAAPPTTGPVPDTNTVQAAFRDSDPADLANLRGAVADARKAIAEIEAAFDRHSPGHSPTLEVLTDMLAACEAVFMRYVGQNAAPSDDAQTETDDEPAEPRPAMRGEAGAIAGPDDVVAALDRITAYYRSAEPSSPVPVILARARRLVRADFLTIIKDMASDGLDEVHRIGGITDDD